MAKLSLLYFASNKTPHEDDAGFERRKNERKKTPKAE
jgi:hypothetical protein